MAVLSPRRPIPYKRKEDQALSGAKWYNDNRELTKQRTAKRRKTHREELRKYVKELKLHSKCADCGYNAMSEALEFDHVRGVKDKNISELVGGGYSLTRLKEEIEKCEVVCAICHRIRTKNRRDEKKNKHRSKRRPNRKGSEASIRGRGIRSDEGRSKQGKVGLSRGGTPGCKANSGKDQCSAKCRGNGKSPKISTTTGG